MMNLDAAYDRPTAEYEKIQLRLKESKDQLALNLGCGPMVWDNWVNIDAYATHPGVLKMDMTAPDFKESSVDAIYSSHSLEHVPIHVGTETFRRWVRLLKPGGSMHLAVPDLENICKIMLSPNINEDTKWSWYIYTMYGYQVDPNIRPNEREAKQNLPVDYGQIHYVCFTKSRLYAWCKKEELTVKELFSYDGYGTPSLYMHAVRNLT